MIYIQLRPRIHSFPNAVRLLTSRKVNSLYCILLLSFITLPINIYLSYSLTLVVAITDISVDGYIFIVPMADGCEYPTFLKLPPVSATLIDSNLDKMFIYCHLATARCNRD